MQISDMLLTVDAAGTVSVVGPINFYGTSTEPLKLPVMVQEAAGNLESPLLHLEQGKFELPILSAIGAHCFPTRVGRVELGFLQEYSQVWTRRLDAIRWMCLQAHPLGRFLASSRWQTLVQPRALLHCTMLWLATLSAAPPCEAKHSCQAYQARLLLEITVHNHCDLMTCLKPTLTASSIAQQPYMLSLVANFHV